MARGDSARRPHFELRHGNGALIERPLVFILPILLAASVTLPVSPATARRSDEARGVPPMAPIGGQAGEPGGQSMFGFRVGEERRYALGPPDALQDGESARWSIELHHLEDVGSGSGEGPASWSGGGPRGRGGGGDGSERRSGPLAVFDLEYTRTELSGPLREPRLTRSIWGEVVVNERGFPLKVTVGERIAEGEVITVYAYDNGRYDKLVRWPETEWGTDLTIPGQADEQTLGGVYLFLSQVPDETLAARGDRAFADNVFANPGLLSLALSYPIPAVASERDLVFLSPGTLLVRYPTQDWMRLQRSSEVRRAHFDRNELKLGDVVETEIGGEIVSARRFELQGPFRNGYVDAIGRVLLLEHDPRGEMEKPRHIRLLRPGESG